MKLRTLFVSFVPAFLVGLAVHGQMHRTNDGRVVVEMGTADVATADANLSRCIRRTGAQWGAACDADGSYQVDLVNSCDQPIRVHWCVREENDRLKCGVSPFIGAGQSVRAQSCNAKRPVEIHYEVCEAGGSCRVHAE